jgi:hypothetical protein
VCWFQFSDRPVEFQLVLDHSIPGQDANQKVRPPVCPEERFDYLDGIADGLETADHARGRPAQMLDLVGCQHARPVRLFTLGPRDAKSEENFSGNEWPSKDG